MNEKIKEAIERIKDIPGMSVGFVFCTPLIMTVDSEIHDYETAVRLREESKSYNWKPGYGPADIMPVFWISEEEVTEDDEFNPLQALKALK